MSPGPGSANRRRGFTLIELMVVVAIVVMAMGIMVPTLLEFFRNQKLKSVRSHFVAAFNVARLMAITESTDALVVFFKEGARVYQANKKMFIEEDFNPESAPGSIEGISFYLRFAGKTNDELKRYRDWEKEDDQKHLNEIPGPENPLARQCSVKGLPGFKYTRDGSVVAIEGTHIPVNLKKEPPDADITVRQTGNDQALYIDVRNTGPARAYFLAAPQDAEE